MIKFSVLLSLMASCIIYSQTVLEADGPGNTYELINSKLAPAGYVVENPECIHPEFGRHIAEVWDSVLNQYIFEFYSHVTPDNDRCLKTDRQRVEIKTYDSSPADLKGVVGETVTYKWRFRLPAGFKPSSSFTHIHQIKPVGGDDGNPLITLTPRKGNPNKLELIHNNTSKVKVVNLSLLEDTWVECTEVITIGASGAYSISIKRVSDGSEILSYTNNNIMTIRPDNNFIRPKWGIYRSLNHPEDLRDEAVRFASFSIQEGTSTGVKHAGNSLPENFALLQNYPNPFNPTTTIKYSIPVTSIKVIDQGKREFSSTTNITLKLYDILGREVTTLIDERQNPGFYEVTFDGSHLSSGIYIYKLNAGVYSSMKKMILAK